MSTLAFPSVGSKLYICTTNAPPATFDAAGYAAQTYVEIKEITSLGMFGKTSGLIVHEPLGEGTTYKFKAGSNSGQLALQGARAPTDAGQAKLLLANDDPLAYSFKLVLANGAATTVYFQGQVMNYNTNVGTSQQITGFESTVEISGNFITV